MLHKVTDEQLLWTGDGQLRLLAAAVVLLVGVLSFLWFRSFLFHPQPGIRKTSPFPLPPLAHLSPPSAPPPIVAERPGTYKATPPPSLPFPAWPSAVETKDPARATMHNQKSQDNKDGSVKIDKEYLEQLMCKAAEWDKLAKVGDIPGNEEKRGKKKQQPPQGGNIPSRSVSIKQEEEPAYVHPEAFAKTAAFVGQQVNFPESFFTRTSRGTTQQQKQEGSMNGPPGGLGNDARKQLQQRQLSISSGSTRKTPSLDASSDASPTTIDVGKQPEIRLRKSTEIKKKSTAAFKSQVQAKSQMQAKPLVNKTTPVDASIIPPGFALLFSKLPMGTNSEEFSRCVGAPGGIRFYRLYSPGDACARDNETSALVVFASREAAREYSVYSWTHGFHMQCVNLFEEFRLGVSSSWKKCPGVSVNIWDGLNITVEDGDFCDITKAIETEGATRVLSINSPIPLAELRSNIEYLHIRPKTRFENIFYRDSYVDEGSRCVRVIFCSVRDAVLVKAYLSQQKMFSDESTIQYLRDPCDRPTASLGWEFVTVNNKAVGRIGNTVDVNKSGSGNIAPVQGKVEESAFKKKLAESFNKQNAPKDTAAEKITDDDLYTDDNREHSFTLAKAAFAPYIQSGPSSDSLGTTSGKPGFSHDLSAPVNSAVTVTRARTRADSLTIGAFGPKYLPTDPIQMGYSIDGGPMVYYPFPTSFVKKSAAREKENVAPDPEIFRFTIDDGPTICLPFNPNRSWDGFALSGQETKRGTWPIISEYLYPLGTVESEGPVEESHTRASGKIPVEVVPLEKNSVHDTTKNALLEDFYKAQSQQGPKIVPAQDVTLNPQVAEKKDAFDEFRCEQEPKIVQITRIQNTAKVVRINATKEEASNQAHFLDTIDNVPIQTVITEEFQNTTENHKETEPIVKMEPTKGRGVMALHTDLITSQWDDLF